MNHKANIPNTDYDMKNSRRMWNISTICVAW